MNTEFINAVKKKFASQTEFINAVKNEFTLRKIIAVALLIVTMVFIITQKDAFLIQKEYNVKDYVYNGKAAQSENMKYLPLSGNDSMEQSFKAESADFNMVEFHFLNEEPAKASGSIEIQIKDAKGNVVGKSEIEMSSINNIRHTYFAFDGDNESVNRARILKHNNDTEASVAKPLKLKKGKKYTAFIQCKKVKAEAPFGMIVTNDTEQASVSYYFQIYVLTVLIIFIALLILTGLIILLPFEYLSRKIIEKKGKEFDLDKTAMRTLFALTPFAMVVLLAKIAGRTTMSSLKLILSLRGILNLLIFVSIMLILYAVTNRTKVTVIVVSAVTVIFGLANYALILFRGDPLCIADLTSIGTAMDVVGTYHITFDKGALWAILIAMIWIALAVGIRGNKGLEKKQRLIIVAAALVVALGTGIMLSDIGYWRDKGIYVNGFRQKKYYKRHGYALAFYLNAVGSHTSKPEGYSVEEIEELADKYKTDEAVKTNETTEQTPNIITIMNESFSDLAVMGDFKTNEDYMPFYNSLTENTIKGTTYVSVYGGATADSELEYQTGFSMEMLPYRSVPYNYGIKTSMPSLTYALKSLGYGGNIAFHPGSVTSYNRCNVYPHLGFDKHVSFEDFEEPKLLRSYMSDEGDFEYVENAYEEYRATGATAPFNMFNVTIQNHGDYMKTNGTVDAGISITDEYAYDEEMEQYLNLVKKSDEAVEGLVNYFSRVSEPTVIVMYGDHQPAANASFVDALQANNGREYASEIEKDEEKYQSKFFIWANFDIEEEENVDISINYLQPYVKKLLGLPMTGFEKYLLELRKEIPAISGVAYTDATGTVHELDDKDNKYGELIKEYERIEYNGLFDTKHRVNRFFFMDESQGESE